MSQEALHVVNSIQGVIKFVGTGKLPQPLRQDEVNRLLGIAEAVSEAEPKEEIPFLVGQVVEITEGPFSDFNGTVEEVIADKGKVRVTVSLFGRPTSVELDYLQLQGALGGYRIPSEAMDLLLVPEHRRARPSRRSGCSVAVPATARVIAAGLGSPRAPADTRSTMAKKIQAVVKLQCPAGAANPAPPVGTALGPHGVNIMEFCKQFNARTQSQAGW